MVLLLVDPGYRNIFHLTTGGNVGVHGDRTPAVWTIGQQLHITFNTHNNVDYIYRETIPLNQRIHFRMEQVLLSDNPTVRIFIDDKMVHQIIHNWKTLFENVKFYLGDPWYNPAPVKIWNLRYTQHS